MLNRTDELELLGLIEGELDPQAEAALRKRLAKEPKALHTINCMKNDRAAMRAIAEPELPVDFLVQIESLLARPMLMEAQTSPVMVNPGELRKQHRRATRRIRWDRLAIAATLMIGIPAGIWAYASGLLSFNRNPADQIAKSGDGDSRNAIGNNSSASTTAQPALPALTAADGTIHHYQPLPLPAHLAEATDDSNSTNMAVATRHVLVADFGVTMQSVSDAGALQSVQTVVAQLGDRVSLVRNFSLAEAARLEEQWRLANGRSRDGDGASPRAAGIDAGGTTGAARLKLLAERVRQQLAMTPLGVGSSGPSPKPIPEEVSGHIVGPMELAPSLEQQLDFSSRGAVFTVTVPAKQLRAFIEQLNLDQGHATALRMLPGAINPSITTPLAATNSVPSALQWLLDGPQVRKSIDRLSKIGDNDVVLIPILVQPEPLKKR